MQRGHLAELGKFVVFPSKNMFGGNSFERIGSEGHVHGVAGARLKIDDHFGKKPVPGGDLSDTPTAMKNIAGGPYLHQRIDLRARDLSGRGQFLKLFSHKTCNLTVRIGIDQWHY